LQSYERDLDDIRSFLKDRSIRLTEAASADLSAYLSSLSRKGFKPSSQARRLAAMRQFYKFLYVENACGVVGPQALGVE
ncbi:site-specific integrase, partial [Rhizobium ruizarguesonis]